METTRRIRADKETQAKVLHTAGNFLMLAGLYLLLYVGGVHVQIDYYRLAARGDSDLPAPQMISTPTREDSAQDEVPAAFTIPILSPARRPPGRSDDSGQQQAPASTISRIILPSIGVDAKVIEVGWDIQVQDGQEMAIWQVAEYAVGHHRGSANPGEGENVVLAGHVGGYGKVFLDLFYMQPGDQVFLYSAGQQYLYVVQERLVLDEEGVSLEQQAANAQYIAPAGHEVVTLVTCWPPTGENKFTQRVVVRALPYGARPTDEQPGGPTNWTPR